MKRHLPAAFAVREDGGCTGATKTSRPAIGQAGESWLRKSVSTGKKDDNPYDPVTTEARIKNAANEMARPSHDSTLSEAPGQKSCGLENVLAIIRRPHAKCAWVKT